MEFFQTLGAVVNRLWKERNYNEEVFSDVATRAISDYPPDQHVAFWDVVRWVMTADHLPPQADIEARFGDPPLTVYVGRKFRIEVLFWIKGIPAVHQHSFSGAFHVLHGSSIHSLWTFEPSEQLEVRLLLGEASFRTAELLRKGDSRTIYAGNRMFHSTFHLDRPSVSVVIRTLEEENKQPQYNLLSPTIAYAPLSPISVVQRQIQILNMLHASERLSEYHDIVRHVVSRQDAYTVFQVLMHAFDATEEEEDRVGILELAKVRHPQLIMAMGEALLKEDLGKRILRVHQNNSSSDHRYLLALLRNIPDHATMLRLIKLRYPSRDPVDLVTGWLRSIPDLSS